MKHLKGIYEGYHVDDDIRNDISDIMIDFTSAGFEIRFDESSSYSLQINIIHKDNTLNASDSPRSILTIDNDSKDAINQMNNYISQNMGLDYVRSYYTQYQETGNITIHHDIFSAKKDGTINLISLLYN